MGARRQARELALQILYLQDLSKLPLEKAAGFVFRETSPESVRVFARHLAEGVSQHRQKIDQLLAKVAENWELERMAAVDRNILRVAALEILTELETPISVIINEAIEIAKSYSTEDSGKFVNGILDRLKNERPSPSLDGCF